MTAARLETKTIVMASLQRLHYDDRTEFVVVGFCFASFHLGSPW